MQGISSLVLTGPSAVGKGIFIHRLLRDLPHFFELSCSYTTRHIRPNETQGEHHYFISKEQFLQKVRRDDFIEYQMIFKNWYGQSKSEFHRISRKGKIPLLDLDIQGVLAVSKHELLKSSQFFMLVPPSLQALEDRIRKRNTETEEQIKLRLGQAKADMEKARASGLFKPDHIIVNDNLDLSYERFRIAVEKAFKLARDPIDATRAHSKHSTETAATKIL